MKIIKLTRGLVTKVDDIDFERLSRFKWLVRAASSEKLYAGRRKPGPHDVSIIILMHREILNAAPDFDVDHINGDSLDNRRENLRLVNASQNAANSRKKAASSSRFKGVSWSKQHQKWRSFIVLNYKQRHLGLFTEEKLAARAYDEAAIRIYGEFARPNFK